MAEALGLGASIIAVLQITGSIINVCYEYQSSVRRASKDMQTLRNALISFRSVLEHLTRIIEAEEDGQPHRLTVLESLNTPGGPIQLVEAELVNLQQKLEPATGWRQKRQALTWPLKDSDIKKVLNTIDRTKATIILAQTTDQIALSLKILDDTTFIKEAAIHGFISLGDQLSTLKYLANGSALDQSRQKVQQWLSPPDPSLNYNESCEKQEPGTGAWLTDSKLFSEWKLGPASLIWLHGIPGSGKSIISSTIITHLATFCTGGDKSAIAYFFFSFNDRTKQDVCGMIKSLVVQLATQNSLAMGVLLRCWQNHQEGMQQPSIETLKGCLQTVVSVYRHTYVVVDALDECTERESLLTTIEDILDWKLGNLHILMSSRKEKEIAETLNPRLSDSVDLDSAVVDPDIASHVRSELLNDPKLRKWPIEIKDEIRNKLTKAAHGMFRWVCCQLDALRKCRRPAEIRKALNSLPKSLDETYSRILMNIDEVDRGDAHKILQWLAFSIRPVTVQEVAEALAVELDNSEGFRPENRFRDPNDILSICSSLVSVSRTFECHWEDCCNGNGSHESLRLSHFSVKEFLISSRVPASLKLWYYVDRDISDAYIAQACLTYLLHFDTSTLDDGSVQTYPLAGYAARYWTEHARILAAGFTTSEPTYSLITRLFLCKGAAFVNWARLFNIDHSHLPQHIRWNDPSQKTTLSVTPLYYMSLLGLTDLVKQTLSDTEVDVNANGGVYGQPLHAAAIYGHIDTVRVLLSYGADVNGDGIFGTATELASGGGHEAIVQLLLSNGAGQNSVGRLTSS